MLLSLIYIIGGLVALTWSADKFIASATQVALRFKLSMAVIGVVILGYGTSFAELFVSVISAFNGKSQLALGNAFGSNVVDIGLILGLTIALAPVAIDRMMVKREIPIAIITTLASMLLMFDGEISRVDGVLMFIALVAQTIYLTMVNKNDSLNVADNTPLGNMLVWLFISLVVMVVSSDFIVKGAVAVATSFGLSNLVIGLTIVAIGTSLPELAASVVAVRKKESDMVMGNIIGSCIFNILGVVSIAAMIMPISVTNVFFNRDASMTLAFTVILWIICLLTKHTLAKAVGYGFMLAYAGYTAYLILG